MKTTPSPCLQTQKSAPAATSFKLFDQQDSYPEEGRVQNDGRWTEAEHRRFVEGLKLFGKDWRLIEEHISTRSCS